MARVAFSLRHEHRHWAYRYLKAWAMREVKGISILGAIMLALSACASTGAICEGSGGTYTGGTCIRSSPGQEAAQKWCETHGGVYLTGPNICAFGEGQ